MYWVLSMNRIELFGDGIGAVELVDHMGSDLTIVNSARVSFGKQKNELDNCFVFFNSEISSLKNLKVIVALGKVAFDACTYLYKSKYYF